MKKIGVVVPVYNAEVYLEQCIKSILNQTYKNIKLVLVDDGSTDHSGDICDHYAHKDSRVCVIHQNNQGMLPARYVGLKDLECDYATFVDADDWIDLVAFEKMQKYMDMEIDMISFRIIRYFNETYQYTSIDNYMTGIYDRERIEQEIYPTMIWNISKNSFGLDPSLCNKIVKKDILLEELEKARDLDISYGQDVAVTYPLVMHLDSLIISEEQLYYHRQRKGNEIADYIADDKFYKKLYWLYEYMIKVFADIQGAKCQIDNFYSVSTKYHLRIYGDKKEQQTALFPFNKVPVMSTIVLYGASVIGQTYYQQIKQLSYATIVAWVDRNYEAYQELGVRRVEYIKEIEQFDYVVIAVNNEETAVSIKNKLMEMGIDERKIIWK